MKKILAVLLAAGMLLSVCAIAVFAAETVKFHVKIDPRCDGGKVQEYDVAEGTKLYKALMPDDFLRNPGYVFMGWYNNRTCMPYNFDAPVTEDVSIYARWQKAGSSSLLGDFDIENIFHMILEVISEAFKRIGSVFSPA